MKLEGVERPVPSGIGQVGRHNFDESVPRDRESNQSNERGEYKSKSGDTSLLATLGEGAVMAVRSRISHQKSSGELEYDTRNVDSVGRGGS